MADLITRQAAIDALGGNEPVGDPSKMDDDDVVKMWERIRIINIINKLPSAQPETHEERTETHSCDCINRKDAVDAHYEYCNKHPDASFPVWSLKILEDLPSAQPEHTNSWYINSWCIDCKEYDTENKCCPRYNRVIKQTLDDAYRHGETEAEARFHTEIVRCKDCRYRDPEDHKCDCGHDIIWQLPRDDKWYCADAERRTDGSD